MNILFSFLIIMQLLFGVLKSIRYFCWWKLQTLKKFDYEKKKSIFSIHGISHSHSLDFMCEETET